jgi:thymidine phosphorylase
VGVATMLLGAGRARVDSTIDPAVGLILHKKIGDPVGVGEPLCTLLVNDERELARASAMIEDAYRIGDEPIDEPPLVVVERIEADFS